MIGLFVCVLVLSFQTGFCGYCDQHTIPFSGIVKNRTRFYLEGESFLVVCDKGYKAAVASGKFTCNKGVWSGHFPPCIPVDCKGPPPSVQNGKIKSFSVQHLSSVVYECNENYYPATPDFKVQCLFGDWIGSSPVCKDSRCKFSDLSKKEGALPMGSIFTPSGHKLNFICKNGYNRTGVEPLCSRGLWTDFGTPPCREANCTTFSVRHGKFMEPKRRRVWKWDRLNFQRIEALKEVKIGTRKSPGTILYISCENKYTFRESGLNNTTTCEKGVWMPQPECIRMSP